ncbi:MAG: hypothetical protein HZB92_04630 [Euryarchaeota archaeon]|nr:hypothetical protein [Euryarchaeota archaeon]
MTRKRSAATLKERILLHLSENMRYAESAEIPERLAQHGISRSLDSPRSHIAIALGGLVESGLVDYRLARVRGQKRKMKAYLLTPEGVAEANGLREHFLCKHVSTGERTATVAELAERERGVPLAILLGCVDPDFRMHRDWMPAQLAAAGEAPAPPVAQETPPAPAAIEVVAKPAPVKAEISPIGESVQAASAGIPTACPRCGDAEPPVRNTYYGPVFRLDTLACARCGFEYAVSKEEYKAPAMPQIYAPGDWKWVVGIPLSIGAFLFFAPFYLLLFEFGGFSLFGGLLCALIPLGMLIGGGFTVLAFLRARHFPGLSAWCALLYASIGLPFIALFFGISGREIGREHLLTAGAAVAAFFIVLLMTCKDRRFFGRLLAFASGATVSAACALATFGGAAVRMPSAVGLLMVSLSMSFLAAAFFRAGMAREDAKELLLFMLGTGIIASSISLWLRDSASAASFVAMAAWAALGLLLCATSLSRTRARVLRDALWRALPLAVGAIFVGAGAIMLYSGLYAESAIEFLVGVPLSAYGLRESLPNLMPVSLGISAYALVLEFVTYAAIFW